MSKKLKEALDSELDPEVTEIKMTIDFNKAPLDQLLEYCKHHNYEKTETDMEKKPLKSTEYAKFIKDEWEQEFMKKLNGLDEVAALLFAAEEMRVPALKELCCACFASHLKGKDVETLKKEFELADEDVDFTPQTEKQMREDYAWIFDAAEKKIKKI